MQVKKSENKIKTLNVNKIKSDMQLEQVVDRACQKKKDPAYEAMISTFGNTAAFKGAPGAVSTPLFKGEKMPSSSTSSVAFDDDEIETFTVCFFQLLSERNFQPNTKRRRTSLQGANVSETELRRQVLQLELKFLEKKKNSLIVFPVKLRSLLKMLQNITIEN